MKLTSKYGRIKTTSLKYMKKEIELPNKEKRVSRQSDFNRLLAVSKTVKEVKEWEM